MTRRDSNLSVDSNALESPRPGSAASPFPGSGTVADGPLGDARDKPDSIFDVVFPLATADSKKRIVSAVRAGCDVDEQNESRNTVMHYAILANDADVVEFLLLRGASVDLKNSNGLTSYDVAQRVNAPEINRLLRFYGVV